MAASLSRPDPSSPASVSEAAFSTARRGYQTDEVRAFLVAVAAEMGRLQERERQLQAELRAALDAAQTVELDDETVAQLLGEETLRVLQTARESASEIKIRAEENAARILREAGDEANRLRQETDIEVARRRQDAQSDAEAEVALAKQQGREMVNEARAYRERVLADLDRRTTLARQQIEELVHGRDRLLQVFERARLVAVDVTSELKAVAEPDELVNLAPTTAPVPIMVPNRRQGEPAVHADEGGTAEVQVADDAASSVPADHRTTQQTPDEIEGVDATDEAADDVAIDEAETTLDDTAGDLDDRVPDQIPDEVDAESNVAEPEADTTGDADADADAETDAETDADADAETEPGEALSPTSGPSAGDTNVVSLFRGRPAPAPGDDADAEDADADTDTGTDTGNDNDTEAGTDTDDDAEPSGVTPPTATHDVGGIFERLRQEAEAQPAPDAAPVEADEPDDDEVDEVDEGSAFTRRDEVIVPLIVASARRLKRVLADEQNEALDRLRQGSPVTALDDLVGPATGHIEAYSSAIVDDLTAAAAGGAAEGGIAASASARSKLVKAGAIDSARDHLTSGLVTPLRDRLARAIGDGAGDNEDITKRVRAVYREWKTQHIDDELDDVFRRAFAGGLHAAVEPGTPLIWTIDPSATACPDCEDNSLAGEVPAGTPFPTGHLTAPGHPGCRCLALPPLNVD